MLPYGFCTLAQLKAHLGIGSDTSQDILLQRIVNLTAGAIEAAAGRPLRRDHARTEYFDGGGREIRLDVSPIAKIHSVRESEDRDFDDSDNYEELVEGTDYVIDGGADGGRKGESGVLKRINGKWLGSERSPGQVQVVYTGGYKTDEEAELENGSGAIRSSSDILDFDIWGPDEGSPANCFIDTTSGLDETSLSFGPTQANILLYRFNATGLLLPTWEYYGWSFSVGIQGDAAEDREARAALVVSDPLATGINDLFGYCRDNDEFSSITVSASGSLSAKTFQPQTSQLDEINTLLQAAIRNQHVSVAVRCAAGAPINAIARIGHATSAMRPALTLYWRNSIQDLFVVPDDLRNANLLQAIHEYQSRRAPGMISEAMRGVAIASGASYLKTQATLLPEVQLIAESYQRFV